MAKRTQGTAPAGADGRTGPNVGERLRSTRLRRRMTLKVVADGAGLSESFLSQLERGRVNPSIGSLQRIAEVLGTTLADLFDPSEGAEVRVVRRDERPSLVYGILGKKYLLTPAPLEHLEVFIGRFEKGGSTGEDSYVHGDSDELFIVMEGQFELRVGDETFVLSEGDCVNYRSSMPHRAVYLGDTVGEVMWVISPPSM
ncbi:cupin domain-containing protein [Conexibacter arvalis]|uniref:Transcriptional regulator with XRE-family HTH domain n=1 Tax=Conexibacter arvalis TaxID=912552 RepID=A0A840IBP1_9ACTN|nr:transcriptional regulator with XRE-family HTH domain [Conexibacter arvalis]